MPATNLTFIGESLTETDMHTYTRWQCGQRASARVNRLTCTTA